MPRPLNLLILTIITFLISCTPDPGTSPITISISDAALIEIPLDQVLANSEFTPLEFTPESALSESAVFLNNESGFLLMDQFKKKIIYQFDTKGRFIRTIGQFGKGPGEYGQLYDALVTNSGIEILTSPNSRVYRYDQNGQFIDADVHLKELSHSFIKSPEVGGYLFATSGYQHMIQKVNAQNGQPVDSFLVRNKKILPVAAQSFGTTTLGKILYYQPFDNRVFGIDSDTISVRYQLDFPTTNPQYDELDHESQMKILTDGEIWYIYKALENSRFLYLFINHEVAKNPSKSRFLNLVYEKKSGKFFKLPESSEPQPLFWPAFCLSEDNVLCTSIPPASVYESDEWIAEFRKRNIPLNPDGNLIVVKIPLGKIIK